MHIQEGIAATPQGELLKVIFGVHADSHPYLRCSVCGAEYYKRRPAFCNKCEYAGGAIECLTPRNVIRRMRKEYGEEYAATVDPYKRLLLESGEPLEEAMRHQVKQLEPQFRERPRFAALLICAYSELSK